ncbi:MAG TPA: hypothetical protein VFY18_00910 [Candidatus Limnocylindrales bacterium]|nr:hypothetical protein [Candidatus Limnocylindrales bacterium]
MTRLVRLYPRRWRDRYEAELIDLLEQRPLSLGASIDLIRGALDAHVHPQAETVPMPWTHRLPGIAVLATGLLWCAAVLIAISMEGSAADQLIGLAAMAVLLGLPGDYMMAYGRRIAAAFGAIALGVVVMFATPWEFAVVVFVAVVALTLGGTLTMAAIRAEIGTTRRWILLVGTVIAPIVLATPIAIGGVGDEAFGRVAAFLIALPYGCAWALLGIRLLVRGSPTIIDPPPSTSGPAVRQEIHA